MKDTFVFTEIFNCAKIGKVAVDSFYRHHKNTELHVFGSVNDIIELRDLCLDRPYIAETVPVEIEKAFMEGHKGTAMLFNWITKYYLPIFRPEVKYIIHFDSDVFFKKESVSIMQDYFKEGYSIIGSRRCYINNPVNIPVHPDSKDTISTYFFGMNIYDIPHYDKHKLDRMWQGAHHPLGYTILDFADPVVHCMIELGKNVKYVHPTLFGGQDETGHKPSYYATNLHMDCGSHLIHFGGVGSGYSVYQGLSKPNESYANWALGRWSLFAKLFYNEDTGFNVPCKIERGRWVWGNYNRQIIEELLKDM